MTIKLWKQAIYSLRCRGMRALPGLILCLLLTSCSFSAAGQITPPPIGLEVPTQTAIATPTLPMPIGTPTLTRPEIDSTKIADFDQQRQDAGALATSITLGTPFVYTPIPIATVVPLPMPILGLNGTCADADRVFYFSGCWTGLINGEYLFVRSGATMDDLSQGVMRVFTSTLDRRVSGHDQWYSTPTRSGLVSIAQVIWPRVILYTRSDSPTATRFVFNLLTRAWEDPGLCPLYPLALDSSVLTKLNKFDMLQDLPYGSGNGDFGWLSWNGNPISDTLALSLIPPGDSTSYINPDNLADHVVSVGDWGVGRPPVINNPAVEQAIAGLTADKAAVVVPVWDQATGQGTTLRYHISGFAWISIKEYSLADPNRLTLRYLGAATCPANP